MENIKDFINDYFTWMSSPAIKASDMLEIEILALLIYQVSK